MGEFTGWSVGEGTPVRVRAAGQALGGPGAPVVQVGAVLPAGSDATEQLDGGLGHAAVRLSGPQRGHPGRVVEGSAGGADE